jgi:predicted DNA-binding transcriptional regulator AlpA
LRGKTHPNFVTPYDIIIIEETTMKAQINERLEGLENDERLLDAPQVMYLLSCKKTFLDKLIQQGNLKPILHGNRYKFFNKEVSSYIEQLKRNRDKGDRNSGTHFLNLILH